MPPLRAGAAVLATALLTLTTGTLVLGLATPASAHDQRPAAPEFTSPYDTRSGGSPRLATTDDPTPLMAGSAEPGSTVKVRVSSSRSGGLNYCSAAVTGSGSWSCVGAALAPGRYSVSAAAWVSRGEASDDGPHFDLEIVAPRRLLRLLRLLRHRRLRRRLRRLAVVTAGHRTGGGTATGGARASRGSRCRTGGPRLGAPPRRRGWAESRRPRTDPWRQGCVVGLRIAGRKCRVGRTPFRPDRARLVGRRRDRRVPLLVTVPETLPPGPHRFVVTVTPTDGSPSTSVRSSVFRARAAEAPRSHEIGQSAADVAAATSSEVDTTGTSLVDPTIFGNSLTPANELYIDGETILFAGLLSALFLLLVALPVELLEGAVRENYGRAFAWLDPIRRRVKAVVAWFHRRFPNPWTSSLLLVAVGAVILGFADPQFGFTGKSARLVIALAISLAVLNIAISAVVLAFGRRRFGIRNAFTPMPAALIVVALSVILSRLTGIPTAFLFGLVVSIVWTHRQTIRQSGALALLLMSPDHRGRRRLVPHLQRAPRGARRGLLARARARGVRRPVPRVAGHPADRAPAAQDPGRPPDLQLVAGRLGRGLRRRADRVRARRDPGGPRSRIPGGAAVGVGRSRSPASPRSR